MIATSLGNSFLGFALSLLLISPLLDVFGAKNVILFAAACYVIGPALILLSPLRGDIGSVYAILNLGMVVCGLGWGATEACINPVTTALYPADKTGRSTCSMAGGRRASSLAGCCRLSCSNGWVPAGRCWSA
jgi:MFS family permease